MSGATPKGLDARLVELERWYRIEHAVAVALADALVQSLDQGDHADGCRWLDVPTASLQTDAQRDHARDNVCDCWRKSARAALRLAGRLP